MVGVFYPYLARLGKWEELKYSLRSLERFLKGIDYEVWIIGDKPEWIKGVNFIPHIRNNNVPAACTFDAVSKLLKYIENKDTPERFIRMYDDIYLLSDIGIKDLEVTRYLYDFKELHRHKFMSGGRVWREQVLRSVNISKRYGFEGLMTETHCPEVFEKGKLSRVFDKFDVKNSRLLTSTLYFNMFPFERRIKDRKSERALFYGKDDDFGFKLPDIGGGGFIEGLINNGTKFMNHNDEGLTPGLIEFLKDKFNSQSRFE